MSGLEAFGSGIAIIGTVAALMAVPAFKIPLPFSLGAIAFGVVFMIVGMVPDSMRPSLPQTVIYGLGVALIVGAAVSQFSSKPKEPPAKPAPAVAPAATPLSASPIPPHPQHTAPKGATDHASVQVGDVTSNHQKGGTTAGYVGSINQGASGD
ncbi:MAG: hypothetical protein WDM85_08600 [Caulobacteraceae bacterium]